MNWKYCFPPDDLDRFEINCNEILTGPRVKNGIERNFLLELPQTVLILIKLIEQNDLHFLQLIRKIYQTQTEIRLDSK